MKKVAASGVRVSKVISVKSLKKKYNNPEARRSLCNRFDVFMAEKEILDMMPSLLGRYFYDVKKIKIPFPIKAINQEAFDKVKDCTRFRLSTGPILGVRIGRLETMTTSEIVANAAAVIPAIESYLEKKENGIVGIDTQVTNSIILPVFISAKIPAYVPAEIKKKRKVIEVAATSADSSDSEVEEKKPATIASLSVSELKAVGRAAGKKTKSQ